MTVQPTADMGSVAGTISDAWTSQPLTATVELVGMHPLTPRTAYQLWATGGDYTLRVSVPGYVAAEFPVTITAAGAAATRNVALEPAQARLTWLPQALEVSLQPGNTLLSTLVISNSGPMPLDVALFEINLDSAERPPTPEDLTGKRILFDRSHGQPASERLQHVDQRRHRGRRGGGRRLVFPGERQCVARLRHPVEQLLRPRAPGA